MTQCNVDNLELSTAKSVGFAQLADNGCLAAATSTAPEAGMELARNAGNATVPEASRRETRKTREDWAVNQCRVLGKQTRKSIKSGTDRLPENAYAHFKRKRATNLTSQSNAVKCCARLAVIGAARNENFTRTTPTTLARCSWSGYARSATAKSIARRSTVFVLVIEFRRIEQ